MIGYIGKCEMISFKVELYFPCICFYGSNRGKCDITYLLSWMHGFLGIKIFLFNTEGNSSMVYRVGIKP